MTIELAKTKKQDTNVSEYVIDLCTLIDSLSQGCSSYVKALKLYDLEDSKTFWKLVNKELQRVVHFATKGISKNIQVSFICNTLWSFF